MSKYLKKLSEIQFDFRELEECTIQLVEGYEITLSDMIKTIELFKGDTKRAEQSLNKFFIFRDYLDEYYRDEDVDEASLLSIANGYKDQLRRNLNDSYPEKAFDLEIIGDSLVDEEPYELCVTFSST